MAALQIHRQEEQGRVTLRLEGTLDGRTALALAQSLEGLGTILEGTHVVVDFSHLREFQDTAVAVLGRNLRQGVQLRGLAGHQERMFRYFGVATEAPGTRAYYTADDLLAS